MAYYRYTNSSYYRPSFFGGFRYFPPVIKWLLIGNVALWLLIGVILRPFVLHDVPVGGPDGILNTFLALWPLGTQFRVWQLITYMFVHGSFLHLLFNMIALWMFGMDLENDWGSRKFLVYYLLCGVGGGISNLLVGPLFGPAGPTVGASGAIYGVLIAFGMMYPDRPIFVYFLLPIRARYFVLIFIAIELWTGINETADHVAHFAHLGGAAVGFVYIMIDRSDNAVRLWLVKIAGRIRLPRHRMQATVFDRSNVSDARFYDMHRNEGRSNQQTIDEILDKISKDGYKSLSEKEKQILFEASKKLN